MGLTNPGHEFDMDITEGLRNNQARGGGAVPSGSVITTEGGNNLTTEGGNQLVTE